MDTTTTSTGDPTPSDRKGNLFCPECGHESPYDGDWVVQGRPAASPDADRVVVVCPDCGTTVEDRPRFSARDGRCECPNAAD